MKDVLLVVPLWLLVLTIAAKTLSPLRSLWQVRCTRKKGYPVLPMSTLVSGLIITAIGLLYYSWLREPVGILSHSFNVAMVTVNIYYKGKQWK